MQIVIDIPKEVYDDYMKCDRNDIMENGACIDRAIYTGTPLPKGYGELADIRPLMRGLYEEMCVGELTYTTSEVYKMLENEAQTIIKADEEE